MTHRLPLLRASLLSVSLLVSSVAVVSAEAGEGAASGSAATPAISGRFTLAATEAEKQARQKSVDKTVDEFFVVTRPIARKKLEAKSRVSSWVDIKQVGNKVTVHVEGREPWTCAIDGTAKGKDTDGEATELTAKWQGDKLVQSVATSEGKRVNTFKLAPDGSLKLTVELTSEKFETPIRYTLSYAPSK
jgi:hypothetical protein